MRLSIHPKVASPLVVGALVGIIVTEAGRHGFTIDGGEASNLTMVLMFLAGLFAPDGAPDPQPQLPKPLADAVEMARGTK